MQWVYLVSFLMYFSDSDDEQDEGEGVRAKTG
jgi:hypothetical protein